MIDESVELVHLSDEFVVILDCPLLQAQFIEFFFIDLHVGLTSDSDEHITTWFGRGKSIASFRVSHAVGEIRLVELVSSFEDKVLELELGVVGFLV